MYTTGHIEKAWALPCGSVRRDIHRGKIPATKSGNQWLIEHAAAESLYGPRPVECFYWYDEDPAAQIFMLDDSEIETEWQHMIIAFHPEPFIPLDKFRDACKLVWVATLTDDENLCDDLRRYQQEYPDMLHPALERTLSPMLET